jgi:phosphate transport system permease protein
MTDIAAPGARALDITSDAARSRVRKRYRAEARFRAYGIAAIAFAALFLIALIGDVVIRAVPAFTASWANLEIAVSAADIDPKGDRSIESLQSGNYDAPVRAALQQLVPGVEDRGSRRLLNGLISSDAGHELRERVLSEPSVVGTVIRQRVLLSDSADLYIKGDNPQISEQERAWLDMLKSQGLIERTFNWRFFTSGDSREAELAGILGALSGSLFTMLITLVLCLPAGVAAAIYLEEFAPKNKWTDLIEVNINNLAAVPSIIFGLLGLAVFLNFFGLPRSTPLVGGLVLALLVLPTIIIASRAALAAVPPSIREGALGVGASHQQAIFHHVLPLAMPGILTGTIIGMAHALGETAPLLLIGMVAFIVDVPSGPMDAATALPVQIFLWSDLPEAAFKAKTAAAIIVLLLFLFVMNGLAIFLRRRFERRW